MAIRDTLGRLLGAKASIIGLSADELPDKALEKSYDDATLLSTYGDDAWPYILGNKVGEQASQAPLQVGRMAGPKGKEEFVPVGPEHPVQHLLDNPNPTMDGGELIHLLVLYMGLTGHSPIEVVKPDNAIIGAPGRRGTRNRAGFELWVHNPGPWRIAANRDGTVKGYLWLRTNETDLRWTPDQMTYLRWPNPVDRWYGQGHIQAVRQQVMAEEYAAIRDKKFEKNLGVPPGILSSEMPLGDPQAAELQKRWEKAVGGYNNAGKIAVLGSKTTYIPVTMTARDAQWLEQRRDRVEIIAAAWGVPLPLIRMQDAKFANASEARAEFWEGTLQPRLNRIARMLTVRLLPLLTSEPLEVRFDYTKIEALGENDLEAAQTAGAWANTGSVTVGEIRHRLGLDPLPDKDVNDRLLIPTTLQLQAPNEVAANAAMAQEAQAAGIDAQRATAETTRKPPKDPNRPPPAKGKADAPDREAALSPIRAAYERDLATYFLAQRGALNGVFKALSTEEAESIIERAIAIVTGKRFRDRLRRVSQGPIESSLTLGATEAARTIGVSVSFAIPSSEAALQRVTGHLESLGVGIQNTTVADVQRVLTEALREGVGNDVIRLRLDELFDGYADWRLDRISRTETTSAYNLGAIGQYRDAGVQTVRVSDGDTDAPCAAANGALWTLEEAEGNPLAHPNCTRTWVPEIDFKAAPRPVERKAEPVVVNVTIAEGAVQSTVNLPPAPDIKVEAPVTVNLPPQPKTLRRDKQGRILGLE